MDKIDLVSIVKESFDQYELNESIGSHGIRHIYDDYSMTFNEMRQIFRDIFSGRTVLTEKIDGCNIFVTYKDGRFCFARNKSTLRDPVDIEKLGKCFNGHELVREAYMNSANDLIRALHSIKAENLNRIFSNGQNFADMTIVYPPYKNVLDYGNKCVLQLNGIDVFDSNFNKISQDKEASDWLFNTLRNHKALKQEMFEISEPNILRMKNSVSAQKALDELMEDFDRVIDGYSRKCSIKDYANERLRRYIINVANHNDIDVDRDCNFIKELADRVGNFSGRRPTKSDICTFAKRAGVNVHGDNFKHMMEEIELHKDAINEEIMRPIENLVMKAGILLLKNLSGYMSGDPNRTSQKLAEELDSVINEVESDNSRLTPQKLKIYRRHMKKLENWKDKICPTGGIICKINGKVYKLIGAFGDIRQILNIFK